ncbi:MAG TPA: amidase [Acidimicrobiales bacterium]|nr:amidase [Acidimicrobiales bacterium]
MTIPLSITEAAALLRAGRLSSAELTAAVLARADALDPVLGVYLDRYDETAMAAAREADRELAAGTDRGPLHGIPIGVKDILATVEGPTTAQSLVLDRGWGAGRDAPVVGRLRAAGVVVTGKSSTMEFAIGAPDPAKPFPLPRNPWDPATWPGGSSSGTGAGVAAGLFLGGLGTDTGGSIRIPAAFCGISGLMPTFGRVPKSGCVPLGYSQDHVGPMARSVRDCAAMLQVMAGHDPTDPDSATVPVPDFGGRLGRSLDGLRIGVVRAHHAPDGADPAVAVAFEAAVATLERLGATAVPVELPQYAEMTAVSLVTLLAEAFAYHRPTFRTHWADYGTPTRLFIGQGLFVSGADVVQAQRVRGMVRRALADLFGQVDVAAMPTMSMGALDYGRMDHLGDYFGLMHTSYWDPAGNPVLAVPMGFNDRGLPLSLQLAAAPFAEPLLVAVGDAYQQATDWHRREPAMVADGPPDVDGLPRPSGRVLPPDPPAPAEAVAATAQLVERAGMAVADDELAHLAGGYAGVSAAVDLLWAVDPGDRPPALHYTAVDPAGDGRAVDPAGG